MRFWKENDNHILTHFTSFISFTNLPLLIISLHHIFLRFISNGTSKPQHKPFITDNLASDSSVSQNPSGSHAASLAIDGNKTSCSKTQGRNSTFQIDLNKASVVTGLLITFGGMFVKIENK